MGTEEYSQGKVEDFCLTKQIGIVPGVGALRTYPINCPKFPSKGNKYEGQFRDA